MASKSIHAIAADVINSLNDLFVVDCEVVGTLFMKKTHQRVWTRGDGIRYKEPSEIVVFYNEKWLKQLAKKRAINFKFVKTDIPALTVNDAAWDALKLLSNVKDMGTVSGYFGSDSFDPAIKYRGVLFIKRDYSIEYASPSILRNTSIWRHHPPKIGK